MRFQNLIQPVSYHQYVSLSEKLRERRKEILLVLEHFPTVTSGKNADLRDLLCVPDDLQKNHIELIEIARGGQYTAHEPGQWVVYPHIDLEKRSWKLGDFLKDFTETLQKSIWEISGISLEEHREDPGLYLSLPPFSKVVSIGIYAKRSFTSFGAAINATNERETFQWIRPCGKDAKSMTSLKNHTDRNLSRAEFFEKLQSLWRNLPKIKP